MAFCKVMIIGNLGRDPEMRYTPNGRPVTQFSVAVSHSKPDGRVAGSTKAPTGSASASSATGPSAPRSSSARATGSSSRAASGRASSKAKDGQKRTSLDVIADNVISLERVARRRGRAFTAPPVAAGGAAGGGGRRSGGGGGGGVSPPAAPTTRDLDDLPF